MLTKQLRHILSSKSIAEGIGLRYKTVDNIIAGYQGDQKKIDDYVLQKVREFLTHHEQQK